MTGDLAGSVDSCKAAMHLVLCQPVLADFLGTQPKLHDHETECAQKDWFLTETTQAGSFRLLRVLKPTAQATA